MSKKSPRGYSDRTLKILWGRAAGRCAVPTCRVELFIDATPFDPMVIIGEIAHIEAASDAGPRANPQMTLKARDNYDNLILLCQNCHARLDGQKNTNTIDLIKQLKNDHEAWVRTSLPERGMSTTGWTVIFLQGIYPFSGESAISALIPDFSFGEPTIIKVNPDQELWDSIHRRLRENIDIILSVNDPFDLRIAVFALAPISACIALGYYLTNRPVVRLFQYHRDEHSWRWPDNNVPTDTIEVLNLPSEPDLEAGELALCFNFSSMINDESITILNLNLLNRIDISLDNPTSAWLSHPNQLVSFGKTVRNVFEKCLITYPYASRWHIFYAGPVPSAVLLGQQLNPTMFPPVQLYEYIRTRSPQYQPSLCLGSP